MSRIDAVDSGILRATRQGRNCHSTSTRRQSDCSTQNGKTDSLGKPLQRNGQDRCSTAERGSHRDRSVPALGQRFEFRQSRRALEDQGLKGEALS